MNPKPFTEGDLCPGPGIYRSRPRKQSSGLLARQLPKLCLLVVKVGPAGLVRNFAAPCSAPAAVRF
jgi:hypothetical protein